MQKQMQQMSCRWRLLGTKKKRNRFQNLEGKSEHFVLLSVGFPFCLFFARVSAMSCSGSTTSGNTIPGPERPGGGAGRKITGGGLGEHHRQE